MNKINIYELAKVSNIGVNTNEEVIYREEIQKVMDFIGEYEKPHDSLKNDRKIEFDDYSQCAIKEIDKGIIDFINIWKTYGFVNNYSILYNKAMYNLSRFIDKPSKQSVIMFSNFKYSDTKVSNIIYTKTNLFNIKNGIVF